MDNTEALRRLKRLLIISAPLVMVGIGAFLYFTYSFIEVTIPGNGNGSSVMLSSQEEQNRAELNIENGTARKLVKRGLYEVIVRSPEGTYFSVASAEGRLTTSRVEARLTKENHREFVGDNPNSCMHYIGSTLVSHSCGSSYPSLQAHMPASQKQPTYTATAPATTAGTIEGLFRSGEGDLLIVRTPTVDNDEASPHASYRIERTPAGLRVFDPVVLNGADQMKYYEAEPFGDGFVLHDRSLKTLLYYRNRSSEPERIAITAPEDGTMKPYSITFKGGRFVAAFSNNTEGELGDIHEARSPLVRTVVVVQRPEGESKAYNFKYQYLSSRLCGKDRLCMLQHETLEVYDISMDDPRLLYSVGGVQSVHDGGDKILAFRSNEVLSLDVNKGEGYIAYSLGKHLFCGVSPGDEKHFTLCLINADQQKVALRLDLTRPDEDGIDKKVLELSGLEEIKSISVYGRYIFITPEVGELRHDPERNVFTYDDGLKRSASSAINQAIDRLGINKDSYIITNPHER